VEYNVGLHSDGIAWRYDHAVTAVRDQRVVAWRSVATGEWHIGSHPLLDDASDEDIARILLVGALIGIGGMGDLLKPTTYRRTNTPIGSPAKRPANNQE